MIAGSPLGFLPMYFMNEHEIDHALDVLTHEAPEYAPYAKFLSDWRDTVNANSDGWAYWKTGRKCADRLCKLVGQASEAAQGRGAYPREADLRKALAPIRAAATRIRLPAPQLQEPVGALPTVGL